MDLSTMEWSVLLPLALALAVTGVAAGLIAGLLGVGGGIVIVPVLYQMFSFLGVEDAVLMHMAVGTSLATILATGFSSARAHWRKGSVDVDLLKRWGPAIAIGVIIGTMIGGNIGGEELTAVFAMVALVVSVNMAFRPAHLTLAKQLPGTPIKELLGTVIGGISVLMGIGGGTLSVPILTLFNYPIHRAVGTAAAIGLIIAVPGMIGYLLFGLDVPGRPAGSLGYISLVGFALIIPTSTLAAPWGAKLAHAINPRTLKLAFAVFLALTSARMFWDLFTNG